MGTNENANGGGSTQPDPKSMKAAAKVRAAQAQKRQRMQWSVGIIVLVVAGIVVLALTKTSTHSTSPSASTGVSTPTGPSTATGRSVAPASVAADLAKVPLSTISAAHSTRLKNDSSYSEPTKVSETALTSGGKPEVLYMGAEFCPYCAAERWPLTVALSKFGTFSDLKLVHSGASDGNVPTVSYYGSTYTSPYLVFTPVELEDRNSKPLESPTAAQSKLLADHGNSFPFIDFGGRYVQSGATVDTSLFIGKDQVDIASQMSGTGPVAARVNAAAGSFIRAICTLTNGKPGDVCSAFPQTRTAP